MAQSYNDNLAYFGAFRFDCELLEWSLSGF